MKVKAIYRNPRPNPFISVPILTADVPNEMPWEEIKKFAKEATPKNHVFVEVVKEEKP